VVWVDKKSESGDTDIQLSMSNNSGNDFKRKILRGGPLLSSSPQIAATEKGDVYVVWVDKKSERDKKNEKEIYSSKIMFRSSNDHGNTFDHAVRLSRNSNHTLNSPSVQATTTEDGSVYVVWSDSGLEFIEIVNRGSVFGKTLSIISNEMTVYSPQIIKSKDGNIYLLWIGQNNDKSKDTGLYVKKISKDYFDRNL